MAESAFWAEMGDVGAELANEIAGELGVTLNFYHRGGSAVAVNGFLRGTNISSELLARIMAAGERIEFFIPAQTNFPPSDGVSEFDQVGWTQPITNTEILLVAETFKDMSSFGTMFSLSCYYPLARQAGAVG